MNKTPITHCGSVALMGAPNVGKSTLLNQMVGQKLAIISPKPQTTRALLRGIVMEGTVQIVFMDTPGVFAAKEKHEKAMVGAAWAGFTESELVLLVVDASKKEIDDKTADVIHQLKIKKGERPVWLALNKADACANKNQLLNLTEHLAAENLFEKTFMISARTGDGVKDMVAALAAQMPEGPYRFDPEDITDAPQRVLAAELTREQLFLQLEQELPYSATVVTDSWEEFENGTVKIQQTIFVQRDGQKGIVIGRRGEQLKAIGAAARTAMKEVFGFDVHLFLHVKVKENWQDMAGFY